MREELKGLSREQLRNMVCEWVTRYHKLECEMSNANQELKERINTQEEKINSLQMELEEEKKKTGTITNDAIFIHADKWDMVNDIKSLKEKNKSLKQQNEYLKSIFESMRLPESPEIVMRKTGMFSEEEIQAHMRANKKIWEDMENTVSENAINKDTLIADFQDQHQQDCIRYNDMRTAYLVTLDELARLREQFGIG